MTPIYCLKIEQHDTYDDEWFGTLKEAKLRRERLIAADPELQNSTGDSNFEIQIVYVGEGIPRRKLVLALLNGGGWLDHREAVVSSYRAVEGATN